VIKSLDEFRYAATVWQTHWNSDYIDYGPDKDIAIKQYGVPKRGWLKQVGRSEFLSAIWRSARNQFDVANIFLTTEKSPSGPPTLVGTWQLVLSARDGKTFPCELTIDASGSKIGSIRSSLGDALIWRRTLDADGKKFVIESQSHEKGRVFSAKLEGTLEGNTMSGSITVTDGKQSSSLTFRGERII